MAVNPYTHPLFETGIFAVSLQERHRVITQTGMDLFTTAASTWKIRRIPQQTFVTSNTCVQISDGDTGTPAAVFSLEVTNGVTTKTVISLATTAGTGGLIRPTKAASVEDGVGFVVPDSTYWLQLRCTTAAATPANVDATCHLYVSGEVEGANYG